MPVPAQVQPQLVDAYRSAVGQLGSLTSGLSNGLETFVLRNTLVSDLTTITSSLIDLFALLALTSYMLMPQVTRLLVRVFPEPHQPTAKDVVSKFEHAVGGYFRGQLLIASTVGAMVGLGL